jgi:hypothetical protein
MGIILDISVLKRALQNKASSRERCMYGKPCQYRLLRIIKTPDCSEIFSFSQLQIGNGRDG